MYRHTAQNKKLCSMNLVSFPEPAFSQRKHKAVADLGGVRAPLTASNVFFHT